MHTLALDDDYKDDGFESGGEKSEDDPIKSEDDPIKSEADNLLESAVEVINDESIAIDESVLEEE